MLEQGGQYFADIFVKYIVLSLIILMFSWKGLLKSHDWFK